MTNTLDFEPDWASAPGETILDTLHARKISTEAFAAQLAMTSEALQGLLAGTHPITTDLADRLSAHLGSTRQFWLNRERQFRADVTRLSEHTRRADDTQWVNSLPVADMIRFGWIPKVTSNADKHAACLRFFDVATLADLFARPEVRTAMRTSPTFHSRPGSVSAWLRQGEIEAARIPCAPWDRDRFRALLPTLRRLTRKGQPQVFLPKLREQCAECGVAVAIVRAPKGCATSGATRFPTPHKAVLILSFRYLSDDQFWFTFFHEAAHLVLHGLDRVFVEWTHTQPSVEEHEANRFSADLLIPPESSAAMQTLPALAMPVIRFAHKIGVSPGIVVGQLQHRGYLRPDQLNFLKRRFEWET